MTGKIEKFIDLMTPLFGPPYKDATGEVVSLLAKQLDQFDQETLVAAAEFFTLHRTYKTWPMPVEIVTACIEAKFRLHPQPGRRAMDDPWADERCRDADLMILSHIGVQAAKDGWLDALWHFCRKQHRLPDAHEAKELPMLQAEAEAAFDRAIDKIADNAAWTEKSTALRNSLADLGDKIHLRSRRNVDRVLAWAGEHR